MSRRSEGQLFVGRLSKDTRTRDLEDVFETYGRLARCEMKYGAEMGYAFVDFEDRRDAEDAMRYENGREVCGSSIIVEWAKGNPRRAMMGGASTRLGYDECYKCHRVGHWARDCPDDKSYGFRRPRGGSRRSRSRSRSPKRRRSRSRERRRRSYSRSASRSRSRDRKRSKRSRTPEKSTSRSPERQSASRKSGSRSPSRERNEAQPNGSGHDAADD